MNKTKEEKKEEEKYRERIACGVLCGFLVCIQRLMTQISPLDDFHVKNRLS